MRKKEEKRERQRLLREQGIQEEDKEDTEEEEDYEYDDYMPQVEYTTICNSDFAPLICNDFVTDYLDKDHGVC